MGNICFLQRLPSRATATCPEALLPRKWPDIACRWEVENIIFGGFAFAYVHAAFYLVLVNCLISTYELSSILFSFLCSAEKVEM